MVRGEQEWVLARGWRLPCHGWIVNGEGDRSPLTWPSLLTEGMRYLGRQQMIQTGRFLEARQRWVYEECDQS